MCDCKDYQTKLEVAEGVIKQMGEPVYLMYQSRLPVTSSMDTVGTYLAPIAIGILIVIGLGFIKPEKVEQPSTITAVKTEIEL